MSFAMLPSTDSYLGWLGTFSGQAVTTVIGQCIAPLTAGQQMILEVCSVWIFWIALAVLRVIQSILKQFRCMCCGGLIEDRVRDQHYMRTLVDLYLFSFSTSCHALIGYLACVDVNVDNQYDRVSYTLPTISCNTSEYQFWRVIAWICLIVFIMARPFVFALLLQRQGQAGRLSKDPFLRPCGRQVAFKEIFGTLYEGHTEGTYWWQSWVLLRRIVFTLVDIFMVIWPTSYRYMAFIFIHLISLLIHQQFQPHPPPRKNNESNLNTIESCTLVALTSLAILLASNPKTSMISQHISIRIGISSVVAIPTIAFLLFAIYMALKNCCSEQPCCRSSSSASPSSHSTYPSLRSMQVPSVEAVTCRQRYCCTCSWPCCPSLTCSPLITCGNCCGRCNTRNNQSDIYDDYSQLREQKSP
jgi:hypothetical protein